MHVCVCTYVYSQMANIVEFLFVFRKQLKLTTCLTFNSLTDALVISAGPGMLAQLHCELLRVSSKACHAVLSMQSIR